MRGTVLCWVVAGFAAFASGAAHAATRAEQTAACRGDAIRLCTFAIPNVAKITACMEQKIDRLSPRCRAMFKPAPARRKARRPG
ncbi:hypothetical protein [Ameyamaea chiangmaiensis]|uniref:hypothetical protein n=1 Tax=Ameyamaea chiangmaiensis TaxID=442969 RepID=UPI001FE89ED4|nr:hypothetical protein [Ameyamaea chiangmaiensis]